MLKHRPKRISIPGWMFDLARKRGCSPSTISKKYRRMRKSWINGLKAKGKINCASCSIPLQMRHRNKEDHLTLDHIIEASARPDLGLEMSNWQPMCQGCQTLKNNKYLRIRSQERRAKRKTSRLLWFLRWKQKYIHSKRLKHYLELLGILGALYLVLHFPLFSLLAEHAL